jgi:hypothetical protein
MRENHRPLRARSGIGADAFHPSAKDANRHRHLQGELSGIVWHN